MRDKNKIKKELIILCILIVLLIISLFIFKLQLEKKDMDIPEETTNINETWLNFDGVDDRVSIADYDRFNINFTGMSWIFWAKQDSYKQYHGYLDKYATQDGNRSWKFIAGTDRIIDATISQWGNSTVIHKSSTVGCGVQDVWTFIGITFNGTRMTFFQNGNYCSSSSDVDFMTIYNGDARLDIGHSQSNNVYFNGSMDEIKIFNSSLTSSQIAYLYYNSSRVGLTPIPILMYHYIQNDSAISDLKVNETAFREQLFWLKNEGFETITDREYYNWTQDQGFIIPNKPIIFIFDDSHNNTIRAAEIMSEYGYKGVSAVLVGSIGTEQMYDGEKYMTWSDLSILVNTYNWSLASHSVWHNNLTKVSKNTLFQEFSLSKAYMIGNISYTPLSFVYPYNSYNSETSIQCSLNYSICFGSVATQFAPKYATKYTNLTNGDLKRFGVSNITTLSEFNNQFNFTVNLEKQIEYNFNENSGTTAYDSSGNENHGTISGATWQREFYK